jgi:hypothetical protein
MTLTTVEPAAAETVTYGGWRKARGLGLFGLGPVATVSALAAVMAGFVLATVSFRLFLLGLPAVAVAFGLTVARWQGETVWDRAQRRVRWAWARRQGYTAYAGGVVGSHPGAWQLPGLLAPTSVLEPDDGRGGRYGLVWDQRSGLLTATLRCDARSTWLVAGPQAEGWVASWHSWLADLGLLALVAWVAVTVDTAPEPGATLAEQVGRRIDPAAPQDAVALLGDLVVCSPAAAADVDTRVSISFDPSRAVEPLADLDAQVAEVNRLLPALEASLTECGVSVLGRAGAAELAGIVRTAFDPHARGEVNRLLAGGPDLAGAELRWAEAGPVGAAEHWDCYQHDTGWSVSWGWHEAPRQQVTSNVLVPLLSPGQWPRRVTLLYRPLSAEAAAQLLENEVNAAMVRSLVRAKQGRDESARDHIDRQRAQQAAREEAVGAGVVRLSMYVTTTVTDPAQLPAAVADVEARARQQSKIRLRRLYGAQAAGFAATLPAGVHPAHAKTRGQK